MPIYREGEGGASIASRRASFLGVLGVVTAPAFTLDQGLLGHRGMAVAMRYHSATSDALFQRGKVGPGARSVSTDLHNGWTVEVFGPVVGAGIFAHGVALALLIAVAALSLLLGLLVFVLGTGRTRALVVVAERTRALKAANTELEEVVGKVTHLATHDALTGLPNRVLFADRASQALAIATREGTCPAVLILDLDRFKEVNDTLGHLHGDLLLTQVAERLRGVLRPGDTVARFGGDEFACLLPDGGSEAGGQVATRIAQALEASFSLDGTHVGIEASVGIATSHGEHATLEELLRKADIAMYKAKTDRSGFAHYAASNDDGTPNRLTLISELRQALDCEGLVVHYQPKVAVDSEMLLGVEALVRWQHPTRGLLMPADFISLAEGSTLIAPLTTFVIESALKFCRTYQDLGLPLPIAVNVSARSICDPSFPATISDCVAAAGVPAQLLTLELTEGTALAYPDLALGILNQLRSSGVHISLDDYGTGYTSMAHLKDLPVTELKIDRAFITGLVEDPHHAAMVQSVTELGHTLGLSVVAEGVEDEQTLALLKTLGVDVAQGYHIARPMPEVHIREWIANRSEPAAARLPDPRPSHHDTTSTAHASQAD